jgi:hypothetical protein
MTLVTVKKCCATCNCWNGPRELINSGKSIRCKNSGDAGNCINENSSYIHKETKADNNGCIKYEKWNQLK